MLRHPAGPAPSVWLLAASAVLGAIIFAPASARAYSPYDVEVLDMIDKGVAYLDSLGNRDFQAMTTGFGGGVGERALVGYAHFKLNGDINAEAVRRGVDAVTWLLDNMDAEGADDRSHGNKVLYSLAVSILLLTEVDAKSYEPQIRQLYRQMQTMRMPSGGYTYPGEPKGDLSQTQYAVLAIWTMQQAGFDINEPELAETVNYILRVQDDDGGWPYHAVDPGPGRRQVNQGGITMSTSLAGGSALLIAADSLRAFGDTSATVKPEYDDLPKALRMYREMNSAASKRAKISPGPVLEAIADCQRYRRNNPYERQRRGAGFDWYYYQLYTTERYESFLELSQGIDKSKLESSPAWYDEGVKELMGYQDPESGAWSKKDFSATSPPVATAFALLFLVRSTQKALNVSRGTLAGGRILPSDTTDIRVEGTQIKGRQVAAQVTDLLDILEADDADKLNGQSLPEDMELSENPSARRVQLDRLERLVRGSRSWQARRVAASLLGKSDELRVVPSLIFALSDPDEIVFYYARDGLRFISRKFEGVGLADNKDIGQVREAQRAWKEWYRKMEPDYVFLDDQRR